MSDAQVPNILVANARVIIVFPSSHDSASHSPVRSSHPRLSIQSPGASYFHRIWTHALTVRGPANGPADYRTVHAGMRGRSRFRDSKGRSNRSKKKVVRLAAQRLPRRRSENLDDLREVTILSVSGTIWPVECERKKCEAHEHRRHLRGDVINALRMASRTHTCLSESAGQSL